MSSDSDKLEIIYERLTGVFQNTYRPLDGIPFFRFVYPPEEEKLALTEFRLLVQRLAVNGYPSVTVSLFDIFKAALCNLFNSTEEELLPKLKEYEQDRSREELLSAFSEYLPEEIVKELLAVFSRHPVPSCMVLTRAGALFPFVRVSSIFSRLEGKTVHIIVVLYPGDQEGAMLRERSFDLAAGDYRGEGLYWR